ILLVLVIGFIVFAYSSFVRTIFVKDLAKTDGINTKFYEYIFMILLAIVVAASVKIVGVILVSALIVLPAATARNLSNSLKQMFFWSVVAGVFSAILGLGVSYIWNLATGPTIVLVSAAFFIISYVLTYLQGRVDSN
ncbi:metal ABC transporter permease, partial [Patescibacteria group bacterium]